jgi:gliding motility-associated-like protein
MGLDPDRDQFMVFDRWGSPLFNSATIGQGWNGQFDNGTEVPEGVYVWKIVGKDRYSSERVEEIGHVTLIR